VKPHSPPFCDLKKKSGSPCLYSVLSLRTFGVKVIPPKEIMKAFPGWFENQNKEVRAAAITLVTELRRWLGKILDKPIGELRPAQAKELEAAFEKLPNEPAVPLKYRRSEAEAMMAAQAAGTGAGGAGSAPKEIDAYELADATNVLSKVTPAFYEGLQSKKWKDRKEQLDMLVGVCDNPKLESGDYAELVKNLKKCLNDANVFVVELATRALGMLGRGLRKEFSQHARNVLPALLDKLKEKKQTVVTAIQEALERMHPHCFGLADIVEDLETASDHKVPQVKSEMLSFVIKCLKTSNRAAMQKQVKPFCGLFMKLMDDGDATVREKSFEAFGVLIGVVSERVVQGFIAKLDKIKEKRVREFIPEGPVGVAGPTGGAAAPAVAAPAPLDAAALADIANSLNSEKGGSAAAKKKSAAPPAAAAAAAAPKKAPSSAIGKPPTATSSSAAAKASPARTKQPATGRGEDGDGSDSSSSGSASVDASGRMDISGKITPKLLQTLDDSDWKKRHEALTQVEQILLEANKKIQPKIGNLFVALKSRLNDSNKNLVQVTLNLLGDFAAAIGPSVEPHMKMIVPSIFVNFTDGKQNVRKLKSRQRIVGRFVASY
jgi:cytoskeleton-associated protein 5